MSSQKKNQLVDLYQESFLAIPRSIFEQCLLFKGSFSSTLLIYLFSYFSSETGQNKTYKRVVVYKLAKEFAEKACKLNNTPLTKKLIKSFDSLIRRAIVEVNNSNIFLISDCSDKGVLFFLPTEKNKLLFKEATDKKMKVDIDIQVTEKIILVSENNLIEFPAKNIKDNSTHTRNDSTFTGNSTKSKMIDWSTFETDLEKAQEALYKEAYIKNHSLQEKELTDRSNVKVETSKMNEVNDDKNKFSNKNQNTEVESKVETSSEDLLKQKAIEKMTETFIKNVQKESSAPGPAPKKISQFTEKSKEILELEDNFHSLGVKEEIYLKALGGHGYETCKAILDDMYNCLRFIQKNEMETIRNKGLYLTQRLEKLDNPEIKFSFICQPYEDTKLVKMKVINPSDPKIFAKSKLMNDFLCFFHERNNYAVNHLSIENKALDLITRVMEHFDSTCKDSYSPEQREKINQIFQSKNMPLLDSFEQVIERKRLLFKSFKEKYHQEGIELLIDLVKLVNDPSLSIEKRNDFINWFEGV